MRGLLLGLLVGCGSAGGSGAGLPVGGTGVSSGTGGGSPSALPTWPGTLEEVRDRILGELMAGRDTEAFSVADPAAFADHRELASRLAVGDLGVAELAAAHGYEVLLARDTYNDRDVAVVWEAEPGLHAGALLVALDPDARPVVFQTPHSQHDGRTGHEGADFFVTLRGRAWMVNTAHRCANAAHTGCSGTSTACGDGSNPYRESDVAHNTATAFQAWHEGLMEAAPELVAVQLHGFGHDPGEPEAYLSAGSGQVHGPETLSNRLAEVLGPSLPSGAASCNRTEDAAIARFCATTNTQGRHLNGSVEPCGTPATAVGNRFLHVEQSWALRNEEGPVHRGLVRDALHQVLPD